jgi:hypothetical protein
MKPSFRNLYMKKLTRERVVPTISASVSWLILGTTVLGMPSFTWRRTVLFRGPSHGKFSKGGHF